MLLPEHHSNTLISSISAPTMTHPSMMTIDSNQDSFYASTPNNNNSSGQVIDSFIDHFSIIIFLLH
jgi:hypothetical protein